MKTNVTFITELLILETIQFRSHGRAQFLNVRIKQAQTVLDGELGTATERGYLRARLTEAQTAVASSQCSCVRQGNPCDFASEFGELRADAMVTA